MLLMDWPRTGLAWTGLDRTGLAQHQTVCDGAELGSPSCSCYVLRAVRCACVCGHGKGTHQKYR